MKKNQILILRRRLAVSLSAIGLFVAMSAAHPSLLAADATLTPTVDFYTNSSGNVASLTNRLLSNINQKVFLEFDVSSIDLNAVTSATLQLYLVYDPQNTQTSRDIVAQTYTSAVTPVEGSAFTYTLGTGSVTASVDATAVSQYWNWDVTGLLVPENVSLNKTISFVMTMSGQTAAVFRFTDSDPANDSTPAKNGYTPQLIVTTAVPEPAATAIIAACIALAVFWVARHRRNS
ncbi:DNRLRE domain-containing protein [Opitutaceae bacterium TAV4]|uniref:DNRLRE domain-containing protein n=1 Tax=Geminisphaera colitermitum TaxID=1148786 RepID=UPI000158D3D9|nr:DNRLRE domain-containing protein [Geminisphaera colitermitum]RRJ97691.1 DNRLRE domain-containing protein [Opitutaceae bacterium TAV4]RRK02228.1 DNRLRE domain-containing protein [Opitutaceae bacterium TAV3]